MFWVAIVAGRRPARRPDRRRAGHRPGRTARARPDLDDGERVGRPLVRVLEQQGTAVSVTDTVDGVGGIDGGTVFIDDADGALDPAVARRIARTARHVVVVGTSGAGLEALLGFHGRPGRPGRRGRHRLDGLVRDPGGGLGCPGHHRRLRVQRATTTPRRTVRADGRRRLARLGTRAHRDAGRRRHPARHDLGVPERHDRHRRERRARPRAARRRRRDSSGTPRRSAPPTPPRPSASSPRRGSRAPSHCSPSSPSRPASGAADGSARSSSSGCPSSSVPPRPPRGVPGCTPAPATAPTPSTPCAIAAVRRIGRLLGLPRSAHVDEVVRRRGRRPPASRTPVSVPCSSAGPPPTTVHSSTAPRRSTTSNAPCAGRPPATDPTSDPDRPGARP